MMVVVFEKHEKNKIKKNMSREQNRGNKTEHRALIGKRLLNKERYVLRLETSSNSFKKILNI